MPKVFKDHRVAELIGIHNMDHLTDHKLLLKRVKSLAHRLRLTPVAEFSHNFPPREGEISGGATAGVVIKESHVIAHLWEGANYLHIDAFSCSPNTNMRSFRKAVEEEFPSDQVRTRKIIYR